MAKFAELNEVLDRAMARLDALDDAAIQARRSTPEALAMQAQNRAKAIASAKRSAARQKAARDAATADASARFAIGQVVCNPRVAVTGAIVAIDGAIITLDNGRKFAAAMLVAA